MNKYDILVVGGGPGGYIAAIRAAQLGAKVALIEKDKVGGTCLNRGCIPTKAILACTNLYDKIRKSENYGITTQGTAIDLAKVIERKDKTVEKIVRGVELLLKKNGIDLIHDTWDGKSDGEKIILATGSYPTQLPGIEFDGKRYFSSDQILDLKEVPDKLTIVGGGVIGIEFAQIFSSLGTEVTVYEALPDILSGVDEDIVANLKRILKRKKVNIITNTPFDPSKTSDKTLICIGRKPNTPGIKVNAKMETDKPGVYAIGDLVSSKQLAHVAFEQGIIAAENAMGGNRTFNYDHVPYGIFTTPEIGGIGLTEKEAREKHGNIKTGKFPYAALGIAQAKGEIEGFIKVVADDSNKLLGIHILGADAVNLLGGAVVAVKNGLTVNQLSGTLQAHPSHPEGLYEAALNVLKKSLHIIN
ncbi:MAG: dihydrolipoyl dehydrogenase [Candidatus Margulisiibacteriota bacterium]|nr:dihydrolipoyl dehydrogenase [Candidatus Margulisiibacteriota bacterium]